MTVTAWSLEWNVLRHRHSLSGYPLLALFACFFFEAYCFSQTNSHMLQDAAASAGEAEEEEPIMVGKGRRRIGSASKKGTGCKTKAKGKAKAKGKKRENEAQDEGADDNEQFSAVTSDGRTTLLIDDMINAISYVTQHVQPEHDTKVPLPLRTFNV